MPWDNQSGGPWGSGSKPPDLEEFLRSSQGMLGGFLPGNSPPSLSWPRRKNSSKSGGPPGPDPHGRIGHCAA